LNGGARRRSTIERVRAQEPIRTPTSGGMTTSDRTSDHAAYQAICRRIRQGVKSQYPCVSAWLRYLCDILSVPPRPAGGVGQCSELLALVVPGSVGAQERPVLGDLNCIGHHTDPDHVADVAVAHPGRRSRRSSPTLRGRPCAGPRPRRWVEPVWRLWLAGPCGRHHPPGAGGRGWRPRHRCGSRGAARRQTRRSRSARRGADPRGSDA
jgi:hypothetical protein